MNENRWNIIREKYMVNVDRSKSTNKFRNVFLITIQENIYQRMFAIIEL